MTSKEHLKQYEIIALIETSSDGLLFRGTRVIIPKNMQPEMIEKAHASHLGIQATLNLCRGIIYWPRMHTEISEAVGQCHVCSELAPNQQKEPMMSYPVPSYPCQVVSSDCFELDGRYYVVVVDHYSDYIDMEELPSMSSNALIKFLKRNFSTHGVPSILITDNGPNYSSREFAGLRAQVRVPACHKVPKLPQKQWPS